MIKAILVFNNHGKPRVNKFYQYYVSHILSLRFCHVIQTHECFRMKPNSNRSSKRLFSWCQNEMTTFVTFWRVGGEFLLSWNMMKTTCTDFSCLQPHRWLGLQIDLSALRHPVLCVLRGQLREWAGHPWPYTSLCRDVGQMLWECLRARPHLSHGQGKVGSILLYILWA